MFAVFYSKLNYLHKIFKQKCVEKFNFINFHWGHNYNGLYNFAEMDTIAIIYI